MPIYKDKKNGTWYAMVRYKDWTGANKQKCQRGFETKREAQEWEYQFKLQKKADIDMTLEAFCELYEKDVKPKLKLSTWLTKESIIKHKIIPYLGKRKIGDRCWKADVTNLFKNHTCPIKLHFQSRHPLL